MMNSSLVRPARLEEDAPEIARVVRACQPGSTISEAQVRSWLQPQAPGRTRLNLVSMGKNGEVTGYAALIHAAEAPAGHYSIWVGVAPSCRRQGIGSALWQAGWHLLREQGASQATSEVSDRDPVALAFAERCGFRVERHRFHSSLDLDHFDEAPYLAAIAALERQGLRFCSMADFSESSQTFDKFYDLNLAVMQDIPGEDWDLSNYRLFFDDTILKAPWFRREGHLLAVDGEAWVGMALISLNPDAHMAYNACTGVIRSYRGRKIALALKVLAARYARQQGAAKMETDNDSLNAPMLAINRKLGYQPQAGQYGLVMELPAQM